MGRTFVLGDIHGAYRALIQCFVKSNFDNENDHLICLGDVCDGWPETKRCIAELLRIKHLTYVLGNHDTWLRKWMKHDIIENIWYVQGGEASIMSYAGASVPEAHLKFLEDAVLYYENDNKLFVHAGIDKNMPLSEQGEETFLWDRTLARQALRSHQKDVSEKLTQYDEVYIGHTPVSDSKPIYAGGVWLMDTGAGWSGVLSMMDIHTKEVFTSDPVPSLYPGVIGRSRS
jgi:serine/threonine protein phosphatase 1